MAGKKEKKPQDKVLSRRISTNETPVPLLDQELRPWIKVIKASRASLTYERLE